VIRHSPDEWNHAARLGGTTSAGDHLESGYGIVGIDWRRAAVAQCPRDRGVELLVGTRLGRDSVHVVASA
jgi:hypothetical protein